MKLFSLLDTQYKVFSDKVNNYLSKTLSRYNTQYGHIAMAFSTNVSMASCIVSFISSIVCRCECVQIQKYGFWTKSQIDAVNLFIWRPYINVVERQRLK